MDGFAALDDALVREVHAAAPPARQRVERVMEHRDLAVALVVSGLARVVEERLRPERQARAVDVRIVVGRAVVVPALIHVEARRQVLAPAEQVVLRQRRLEKGQRVPLVLEVAVEAKAPDVARDEQQVDLPRDRRQDRHHRDDARQLRLTEGTPREDDRRRRLHVARGLLDQRLVIGLAGPEKDLALEDVRPRRPVEDVEQLEVPVAAREDRLVDDVDAADRLSLRRRIDSDMEAGQRVVDRLLFQAPELTLVAAGRGALRAREPGRGGQHQRGQDRNRSGATGQGSPSVRQRPCQLDRARRESGLNGGR